MGAGQAAFADCCCSEAEDPLRGRRMQADHLSELQSDFSETPPRVPKRPRRGPRKQQPATHLQQQPAQQDGGRKRGPRKRGGSPQPPRPVEVDAETRRAKSSSSPRSPSGATAQDAQVDSLVPAQQTRPDPSGASPDDAGEDTTVLLLVQLEDLDNQDLGIDEVMRLWQRFEQEHADDHRSLVLGLKKLCAAPAVKKHPEKHRELLDRAESHTSAAHGARSPEVAELLLERAILRTAPYEAKEKKALLQEALDMLRANFGDDSVQVARVKVRLGNACGNLGEHRDKVVMLEDALRVLVPQFGELDPEVAATFTNLGNALSVLGRMEEARLHLERALTIKEQLYGPEHPEVAVTLTSLSTCHGALGNVNEQKQLLQRALHSLESSEGNTAKLAVTVGNLGRVYLTLGKPTEALPLLERARGLQESSLGPEHPQLAPLLYLLGFAYQNLQDLKQKSRWMMDDGQVISSGLTVQDAVQQVGLLERSLRILERSGSNFDPLVGKVATLLEKARTNQALAEEAEGR